MSDEQLFLTIKAVGVLALTIVAGIQTVLASELVTAAIPAVTTALGLAALVWKLATDRTATQDANRQWLDQSNRYEAMLNRSDARIADLEAEVAALQAKLYDHRPPPPEGEGA